MTDPLGPYPKYKDSGVPWLGKVPAHWQQLPGRACFIEKKTPNAGMQETTVLSLSYGQIVVKPPEKLHGLVPASFETYQIIEPYDIVIRPTDLQNDWVSLRTGLAKRKGIITSAYMRLRTKAQLAPEYGRLLLHAYDLKKVFYGLGSGLRQNLSWRDFKYLPCLVPPPDEQAAIARFLVHIDRLTRRYIRAQRRLIELLEEQKQALIQQAVTRGLDPDVPLKDSGIEWLGEIPAHWETRKLKHIKETSSNSFVDGPFGSNLKSVHYVPNGDVYIVESGFITTGRFRFKEFKTITSEHFETIKRSTCQGGDIVIAKIGANFGMAGILPDLDKPAVLSGNSMKLTVNTQICSNEYVHYALLSARRLGALDLIVNATAQPALSLKAMNNLPIPLPDLQEQRKIIAFVDHETANLNSGIEKTGRQIDLIREYRTRLIADVVTGKLDVRGVSLPDLDEDQTAFDDGKDIPDYDDLEGQEMNDDETQPAD